MWKKKACVSVRVLMFARTCERVFRLYHKKDEGGGGSTQFTIEGLTSIRQG